MNFVFILANKNANRSLCEGSMTSEGNRWRHKDSAANQRRPWQLELGRCGFFTFFSVVVVVVSHPPWTCSTFDPWRHQGPLAAVRRQPWRLIDSASFQFNSMIYFTAFSFSRKFFYLFNPFMEFAWNLHKMAPDLHN